MDGLQIDIEIGKKGKRTKKSYDIQTFNYRLSLFDVFL